jgi:aryl-alcohol dehydrogenase-like predicted oxidoreductase
MGECNKDSTYAILDHFHAAGGNFVDTANYYMDGESEEWLGDWMGDRNVRDQMVIATKYTMPYNVPDHFPEGSITSNIGGSNRKSLRLSLSESLKRLKTDYVDILYVHAWDGVTSIPELMRSLDDVVKQGKVLYLGISNWPAWLVVKANDYARQHCLTPFVVYQGLWNVVARDIERDVVPMCKAEGMAITIWEAMGAGKFKSRAEKAGQENRVTYDMSGKGLDAYERAADALERIGKRKGTNGPGIALRYITLKVRAPLREERRILMTATGSLRVPNHWRPKDRAIRCQH